MPSNLSESVWLCVYWFAALQCIYAETINVETRDYRWLPMAFFVVMLYVQQSINFAAGCLTAIKVFDRLNGGGGNMLLIHTHSDWVLLLTTRNESFVHWIGLIHAYSKHFDSFILCMLANGPFQLSAQCHTKPKKCPDRNVNVLAFIWLFFCYVSMMLSSECDRNSCHCSMTCIHVSMQYFRYFEIQEAQNETEIPWIKCTETSDVRFFYVVPHPYTKITSKHFFSFFVKFSSTFT